MMGVEQCAPVAVYCRLDGPHSGSGAGDGVVDWRWLLALMRQAALNGAWVTPAVLKLTNRDGLGQGQGRALFQNTAIASSSSAEDTRKKA